MATGINQIINWLLSWLPWLGWSVAPDSVWGYVLAAGVHILLLLNLVAVGALLFIWMERKVSGRIQDRLGPTRVGGKFGWLQTLADGLKLLTKEDLMPEGADEFLFKLAPYISFCASLAAFMAIPFAGGEYPFVALHLNVAVFFIIAVLGLEVFGVILAGYSSASKWSLFGAMREAAQVVSYEVPLGMCAVVPVLIAGSMDLVFIGDRQAGSFLNWYVFHDPFTFITFWVYFTCATASVNRAPFDLAEAESELVAGFHTEYSGLRWSFFFMAEYGSMMAVSLLASILFLGGWHGPLPVGQWLGLTFAHGFWYGFAGNVLGTANILTKGIAGVTVMMWVRWTLPRLRIDQVITTCLKYCVPIAAVMFLLATCWQYALPSRSFFGVFEAPQPIYELSQALGEIRIATSDSPRTEDGRRALGRRRSNGTCRKLTDEIVDHSIYWPSFFFLLFAAIACAFAVTVVLSPNIVRMAFYLVMSLAATAGLFFLAGADFVGSMQILIYVGGTLVLLVFGVMLTSQDRFISMRTNRGEMIIAGLVGASLLAVLVAAAISVPAWGGLTRDQVAAIALQPTATPVGMGLLGVRVDDPSRSGYLLIFEMISVHLLVVLICAAYLARPRGKRSTLPE